MSCRKGIDWAIIPPLWIAGMAELVDALDSKSSDGDIVPVRFRLSVPTLKPTYVGFFVSVFGAMRHNIKRPCSSCF